MQRIYFQDSQEKELKRYSTTCATLILVSHVKASAERKLRQTTSNYHSGHLFMAKRILLISLQ